MAINIFGIRIGTKKHVAFGVDRVVAALKETEIGDAAVDSVRALMDKDMPGSVKLETVVKEIAPRIALYAAAGLPQLQKDAEHVARHLAQSVFVEVKADSTLATLLNLLAKKLKL